ncbi:MAG: ABC transporter ATP-binding protein/permease [Pseudomonadota bacterium]
MPGFDDVRAEPRPFWRSVTRMVGALWRPEMKRWRFRMVCALVLTVAAKALSVLAPVLIGSGINAVTEAANGSLQQVPDTALRSFVGLFLLYGLVRFLSNGLPQVRDAFFSRVTQDANRMIAVDAFAHAQRQDLQFHVTRRAGALNRIIDRGAAAIEFILRFLVFNIGPTIVELIFAASVMAALYSWKLAVATVLTVVAYAWLTIAVTEWRTRLRREMNQADTELRAISMDTLMNFETVKSFAAEDRESGRFEAAMRRYNAKNVRSMQSMNLLNGLQETVMSAGLVAVAIIAGYAAANGSIKAGDIAAVILMLGNIYRPLNILGFAWREIKRGAVDIEKLYDLLDTPPTVQDIAGAQPLKVTEGAICFDSVSFAHEGRLSGIQSVSFDVEAGAFVGLVGPSGAGKSTILRVLQRFYDPSTGDILIDGQNIRNVQQTSLRRSIGIVPQEVSLFNDTLRSNIAYAKPEASDREILEAAEKAQLTEFIMALPDGLNTLVGERGLKLSGGEKQRVGVARAILLDPPILILDEATSSLDSETEHELQAALVQATEGRTTIAVAHRLSTLARASKIIVLEKGEIIEQGDHQTLLQNDSLYASLWRRQNDAAASEGSKAVGEEILL